MKKTIFFVLVWLVMPASAAHADSGFVCESGLAQNYFVEMYTSDADRNCNPGLSWMTSLKVNDTGSLWKEFVPVTFHVDLWDSKACRDSFAQKKFSDLLMSYKKKWGIGFLHQPTVAVNGTEWSGWLRGQDIPRTTSKNVGVLSADGSKKEGHFLVTFTPAQEGLSKDLTAHAALLAFGLKSKPSDGNNRGNSLTHDFIVVQYQEKPMRLLTRDVFYTADLEIVPKKDLQHVPYAMAFWVTQSGEAAPIQAAGDYLKK